jgi:peptide/nickel transport system permease protein
MVAFLIRRLGYSVLVLLVASIITFVGVRATFNPLAKFATLKDRTAVARAKHSLGLDKPLMVQYGTFIGHFVEGDWGTSSRTGDSVSSMIGPAMQNTLQLIVPGIIISLILAITLGIYSAVKQYSIGDYAFTGLSFLGISMPPFWFGLIAIEFLAFKPKQWFGLSQTPLDFVGLHTPGRSGINVDYFQHLLLPVLTLTIQSIAEWSRYQRASMLDVLSLDYVRTATAKGVPRRTVIMKHGFRNALIPLVSVVAIDIGALFGGLVITEQIFSIQGMGKVFVDALNAGDSQVIAVWLLVTAFFIILFNLIADLAYGVLDPRVRLA